MIREEPLEEQPLEEQPPKEEPLNGSLWRQRDQGRNDGYVTTQEGSTVRRIGGSGQGSMHLNQSRARDGMNDRAGATGTVVRETFSSPKKNPCICKEQQTKVV